MSKYHVEKLIVAQLGTTFCAFYGKKNLYYRVEDTRPLVPILSPMNPVHCLPCYFQKIHFVLSYMFWQLVLLLQVFRPKLCMPHLIYPPRLAKPNNAWRGA
jgi:hypothetical protein